MPCGLTALHFSADYIFLVLWSRWLFKYNHSCGGMAGVALFMTGGEQVIVKTTLLLLPLSLSLCLYVSLSPFFSEYLNSWFRLNINYSLSFPSLCVC